MWYCISIHLCNAILHLHTFLQYTTFAYTSTMWSVFEFTSAMWYHVCIHFCNVMLCWNTPLQCATEFAYTYAKWYCIFKHFCNVLLHLHTHTEQFSAIKNIHSNFQHQNYCQTSNTSCTLMGNKIVDHSDVVGASLTGTAPTTSSF